MSFQFLNRFQGLPQKDRQRLLALGLVLLGISALSLLGSWWLDPKFSGVNLGIALAGFAGMTACLLFYLVIKHGVRGTFSVIHTLRKR